MTREQRLIKIEIAKIKGYFYELHSLENTEKAFLLTVSELKKQITFDKRNEVILQPCGTEIKKIEKKLIKCGFTVIRTKGNDFKEILIVRGVNYGIYIS